MKVNKHERKTDKYSRHSRYRTLVFGIYTNRSYAARNDRRTISVKPFTPCNRLVYSSYLWYFLDMGPYLCYLWAAGCHCRHLLCVVRSYVPAILYQFYIEPF